VRQHTEGVVENNTCFWLHIWFPYQQWKNWKFVKNWQSYRHEFGVL